MPVVLAAAVMLPVSAAQAEAPRPYRIGVLNEAWAANHPTVEGLKAGLRARGLAEGREVNFELHFTEGKGDELPSEARALIKANVDLILTNNEAAALAARTPPRKSRDRLHPLVANPVAAGIVSNLARPGGNLTRHFLAGGATQIVAKRTADPAHARVGVSPCVWFIYSRATPSMRSGHRRRSGAKTLKVELVVRAVESAEHQRTRLEVGLGDGLLAPENDALDITVAILDKLWARACRRFATAHWVARGGLISCGPDPRARRLRRRHRGED
ncbi:MAG: hypothetical protein IPO58_19695, partial [Betaproteobacteria bacterium]|nr:hypothetical protein [Betaproteobacteria bacterium]